MGRDSEKPRAEDRPTGGRTPADGGQNTHQLPPAAILEGLAFVSKVFWGPELGYCRAIHQEGGRAISRELALLSSAEAFSGTVAKIGAVVRSYQDGEALFQNLESEYVSLFISNRQGIAAPLYHSCYAGPEGPGRLAMLMGEPALEMKKRLASSGLALTEALNQPPDHLCIEIEYLYFMLREAWNGKGKELSAEARRFARDWMLPWVRQFQNRVRAAEEAGFYTLVSVLLIDLLTIIGGKCSR